MVPRRAGTPIGNRSEGQAAGGAHPPTDLGLGAARTGLVLVVCALALAWREVLRLPLVGEDYFQLAGVRAGGEAYPHLFRPLPSLWFKVMHAAFGAESAVPYHAGSLALHALNALLLYAAAVHLFGRRAPALVAALAFAVNAAACDAVTWVAAVARPVSVLGMLCAWNGLVRWRSHPRLAEALLFAGLLWQLFSLEEVYGTALVAAAWLALQAARGARPRAALVCAALALLLAAVHYLWLQRVPGGAQGFLEQGLARAPANALQRSRDVVAGLGVPGAAAALLPLALALPLLAARRFEAAAFALLAWLGSFVPFALDDPVDYRAYDTVAPTALLLAGALHGLAALGAGVLLERALCAAAAFFALLGAAPPRGARLLLWWDATREAAAVERIVRARAWSPPEAVPALVNLDSTSAGVLVYWLGLGGVEDLSSVGFLDGAGGWVRPADAPPGPWIGRRVDGSYGEIDPAEYFAGRPELPELRLAGELHQAADLDGARALLASPAVDLARGAVVETDAAALGARSGAGEVRVLEPFAGDAAAVTGRMVVEVRAEGPTVLAVCSPWQYSHVWRVSRDQMLFSDVDSERVLRLEARVEGEGAPRQGFFLDAFGFGVPVPAGRHAVELRWRRASPGELRSARGAAGSAD